MLQSQYLQLKNKTLKGQGLLVFTLLVTRGFLFVTRFYYVAQAGLKRTQLHLDFMNKAVPVCAVQYHPSRPTRSVNPALGLHARCLDPGIIIDTSPSTTLPFVSISVY